MPVGMCVATAAALYQLSTANNVNEQLGWFLQSGNYKRAATGLAVDATSSRQHTDTKDYSGADCFYESHGSCLVIVFYSGQGLMRSAQSVVYATPCGTKAHRTMIQWENRDKKARFWWPNSVEKNTPTIQSEYRASYQSIRHGTIWLWKGEQSFIWYMYRYTCTYTWAFTQLVRILPRILPTDTRKLFKSILR